MRLIALIMTALLLCMPVAGQGSKHRHDGGEYSYQSKAREFIEEYRQQMLDDKPWIPSYDISCWRFGVPPGWSDPALATDLERIMISYPPDWYSRTEEDRMDWASQLEQYKERLRVRTVYLKHLKYADICSAVVSFEAMSRCGVPLHHGFNAVSRTMEKKFRARDIEMISRAYASAVGKGVDFSDLTSYLGWILARSSSGEEIAISLYRKIYQLSQ